MALRACRRRSALITFVTGLLGSIFTSWPEPWLRSSALAAPIDGVLSRSSFLRDYHAVGRGPLGADYFSSRSISAGNDECRQAASLRTSYRTSSGGLAAGGSSGL